MVWVNSENNRHLPTPFGGVKASGIGRDGGDYSLRLLHGNEEHRDRARQSGRRRRSVRNRERRDPSPGRPDGQLDLSLWER